MNYKEFLKLDNIKKNEIIADKIMDEPKPSYTSTENSEQLQLLGIPVKSKLKQWREVCFYETGDMPTRYPLSFMEDDTLVPSILNKMNSKGYSILMDKYPNESWYVSFSVIVEHGGVIFEENKGEAFDCNSLAETVCIAALRTVGEIKE